jgi:membrane protease YdiL (CAAX protease family)
MHHDKNDSIRIAISAFIVATTLTLFATEVKIPNSIAIPAGALMIGASISSIFAVLFILAKGYELRYKSSGKNFIDKSNYLLYNLAMTAYVFVIALIAVAFAHKYLKDVASNGNVLGDVGIVILFLLLLFIINGKDIVSVFGSILSKLKSKRTLK